MIRGLTQQQPLLLLCVSIFASATASGTHTPLCAKAPQHLFLQLSQPLLAVWVTVSRKDEEKEAKKKKSQIKRDVAEGAEAISDKK